MTTYQRILSAFQGEGFYQDSLMNQNQINRALDNLSNQNAQIPQFDRNVSSQLWDETLKEPDGKVILKNYIETIAKGQSIIRNQITYAEQQLSQNPNAPDKHQKQQNLLSYIEDHRYLTVPFGLSGPNSSRVVGSAKLDHSRRSSVSTSTVIFTKDPKRGRGKSTDLKFAFFFTVICFLIEIIMMYHKHHFFNLLIYLSIFAIFFLNYFDHYYMKFILATLGLSVLLDIVWMIFMVRAYWYPNPETQHSSLQYGFLKIIVLLIFALIFVKIVLVGILFKYRNNPQNLRKQCTIYGTTFPLDGTSTSPIARIIKGVDPGYSSQNNEFNNF